MSIRKNMSYNLNMENNLIINILALVIIKIVEIYEIDTNAFIIVEII